MDTAYGEEVPPIRIHWDSSKLLKKSERIKWRGSHNTRQKSPTRLMADVSPGVEEEPLVGPEDKPLTTDFTYFTIEKLKNII